MTDRADSVKRKTPATLQEAKQQPAKRRKASPDSIDPPTSPARHEPGTVPVTTDDCAKCHKRKAVRFVGAVDPHRCAVCLVESAVHQDIVHCAMCAERFTGTIWSVEVEPQKLTAFDVTGVDIDDGTVVGVTEDRRVICDRCSDILLAARQAEYPICSVCEDHTEPSLFDAKSGHCKFCIRDQRRLARKSTKAGAGSASV